MTDMIKKVLALKAARLLVESYNRKTGEYDDAKLLDARHVAQAVFTDFDKHGNVDHRYLRMGADTEDGQEGAA